ncbi:V-ATPase proteolipid subunit C-like domain-containing protein [Microdochium bolleyi]|uniref:V-type proton ATPase proteolipid subunit n=1 Tax=Microdochium bolleyi TaxID=196109 RepID=A0A136JC81_9PEZI|nr:V-ATPase proteolipid subunit C-like domain-containing protein [Microdochium bolleyi]
MMQEQFPTGAFVAMDDPAMINHERCPVYSSFFGAMGCSAAIIFTVLGASYGTAKSSGAIFSSGIIRPDRLMQNTLCAVMAQILAIYGLVAAVIISGDLTEKMPLHQGFLQFGAGISVGLCGMAAGFSIGIIGDAGVRASTQQPRLYVGMVLILIFAEVLGLYGVIVSILMLTKSRQNVTECTF